MGNKQTILNKHLTLLLAKLAELQNFIKIGLKKIIDSLCSQYYFVSQKHGPRKWH
jgi:hypothetical protein